MLRWQREIITDHLVDLLKNTDCSLVLIADLKQRGILGDSEINSLKAQGLDAHAKNFELYEIVQRKLNGFEKLYLALMKCDQAAIAEILLKDLKNNVNRREEYEALTKAWFQEINPEDTSTSVSATDLPDAPTHPIQEQNSASNMDISE